MENRRNILPIPQASRYSDAFRNEEGAIDLASIMVGVLVIGLIGGVIAATIFAVIPWAQDQAAKQQLDSLVQAENAYLGFSSVTPSQLPAGSRTNSYGYSNELEAANLLRQGPTYCAIATPDFKGFNAYSQSASGHVFISSDNHTKPELFPGSLPANCQYIADNYATGGTQTSPGYVDSTPSLTTMTFNCAATTTAPAFWYSSIKGTETWSDGTTFTYNNAISPTNKTLQAGVTYHVTLDGTYRQMSFTSLNSCLRSVDHWGLNTGVTSAINAFYGAGNLTSVPAHIPTTITDMSQMFSGATIFNDPNVDQWDVSHVTTMYGMFKSAKAFNQSLNDWNTGAVTNMQYMFYLSNFNNQISNWDVSKVTNMADMFDTDPAFNQNINNWNVGNVITTKSMFWAASAFNQPLNSWNVSNVTQMTGMFYGTTVFDQDLSSWDVSKVTSFSTTFQNAIAFNHPLNSWNVSAAKDMGSMFLGTKAFNQDLGSWNTSNVTTMFGMFNNAKGFNHPSINNWNVSSVTNMEYMFAGATAFNQPLNSWDVSNVTDPRFMFDGATAFNGDITSWNVTKMTSMNSMFYGATNFNQPLNNWDVSNTTQFSYMFNAASSFNQPLDKWNVTNAKQMDYMFASGSGFNQNILGWNVANVTSMYAMFYQNGKFMYDMHTWNTPSTMDGRYWESGSFPLSYLPPYTTRF